MSATESAKSMESLRKAQELRDERKIEGGGRKIGEGGWKETKKRRRVRGRGKEEMERSRYDRRKERKKLTQSTCRRCLFCSCQAK